VRWASNPERRLISEEELWRKIATMGQIIGDEGASCPHVASISS
jgi:hypothetical protein